jgi:hypothetical protein
MVSCMTMSNEPQAAQMNKKPPQEFSLDWTLTQHPHDENLELWNVCLRFEIEIART